MDSLYLPDYYDLFNRRSIGGDIEWYLEQAAGVDGPVLELGAGTGRTLLPLARAGHTIWGLERDPAMLERLREHLADEPPEVRERVTLIEGDMRALCLEQRFAMIQIPFRAFLHNITRDEQLRCLRGCYAHLRPDGGLLAFNLFHPSLEIIASSAGHHAGTWRWVGDHPHPEGGFVIVSEARRYETCEQRVSVRVRHEHVDDEGELLDVRFATIEIAYLYPGDLRDLLGAAGFDEVRIEGDYDGQPVAHDTQELAVRAWRRAARGLRPEQETP